MQWNSTILLFPIRKIIRRTHDAPNSSSSNPISLNLDFGVVVVTVRVVLILASFFWQNFTFMSKWFKYGHLYRCGISVIFDDLSIPVPNSFIVSNVPRHIPQTFLNATTCPVTARVFYFIFVCNINLIVKHE